MTDEGVERALVKWEELKHVYRAVAGKPPGRIGEKHLGPLVQALSDLADEQALFAPQLPAIYDQRLREARQAIENFCNDVLGKEPRHDSAD